MINERQLQNLAKLSQELNTETDSFNKSILDLEKRLADMNIGVSVWRRGVDKYLCRHEEQRDGDPENYRTVSGWIWGYDKVGDAWRFGVQKRTDVWCYAPEGDDANGKEPQFVRCIEKQPPVPLTSAPRAVRIEAPEHIKELLDGIENTMKKLLKRIKQARTEIA